MASPNKVGVWADKKFYEPLSHGREFTKEEIWENYTYFIKQVAPVADENSCPPGFTRTIHRERFHFRPSKCTNVGNKTPEPHREARSTCPDS
jgi:hypothetical protein